MGKREKAMGKRERAPKAWNKEIQRELILVYIFPQTKEKRGESLGPLRRNKKRKRRKRKRHQCF